MDSVIPIKTNITNINNQQVVQKSRLIRNEFRNEPITQANMVSFVWSKILVLIAVC